MHPAIPETNTTRSPWFKSHGPCTEAMPGRYTAQ